MSSLVQGLPGKILLHNQYQRLSSRRERQFRTTNCNPKMVAKKIRDMKDNKSLGVDGILPKLLVEIVEQISIPFATGFNLSLEEGEFPLEWKEANIIPFNHSLKIGPRNKSYNYRPVNLTSVICMLLERLIKDHLVKHNVINPPQHGFLKVRSCLTNFLYFF